MFKRMQKIALRNLHKNTSSLIFYRTSNNLLSIDISYWDINLIQSCFSLRVFICLFYKENITLKEIKPRLKFSTCHLLGE